MDQMEKLDLLKAALAVAAADGTIRRSELGVARVLAERLGVGEASFDAMVELAEEDDSIADNILIKEPAKANTALELLVAEARIDGEISRAERALLVRIARSLKIDDQDFPVIYQAGIRRADRIRETRR
ncbi:MAG: hypothetical protein ACE5EX_07980 [Phycisphaerae bacterium]